MKICYDYLYSPNAPRFPKSTRRHQHHHHHYNNMTYFYLILIFFWQFRTDLHNSLTVTAANSGKTFDMFFPVMLKCFTTRQL